MDKQQFVLAKIPIKLIIKDKYKINITDDELKTFKEWRSEILRSFISRYSNGYIEGHNNKIKVIKRISFGIKSLKILRLRVLYMA